MLLKLTTQFPRETQIAFLIFGCLGSLVCLIFIEGVFWKRLLYIVANSLVFPITFGMTWLMLRMHIWIGILPLYMIRFACYFFFFLSIIFASISIMTPIFYNDLDMLESIAVMTWGMLGFGFASFRIYRRHFTPKKN